MGMSINHWNMDDSTYDITLDGLENKMNKQMLFGLPIGTRVTLGDKSGVLTNASAMEIFKTYEITFDDGEVITRDELIDKDKEEWELIPNEELKETLRKRDWYKSEMEHNRKDIIELKERITLSDQRLKDCVSNNAGLIKRLKDAVDKTQELTTENVKLTKRLDELIGDKTIVIEEGDVKTRVRGLGLKAEDIQSFEHSPDIYSSGPMGAPVKLATEIVKVLNKENVEKILKEAGGSTKVGVIAEATKSSAKAVYRFISKTTGIFVGKLPEPEYKEENADAWLEGQQAKSEPEVEVVTDAPERSESPESPPESDVPLKVEGADEGSEDEQGGDNGSD